MQKAKQQGLPIYITKIEGIAPFKWFIESVILIFEDRSELHLENIRLRIDLLDLLKIHISQCIFMSIYFTKIFNINL